VELLRIWDLYCNAAWFHLCSSTVYCILSTLVKLPSSWFKSKLVISKTKTRSEIQALWWSLERVWAMPYYLWHVCLYNIFPHYLINGTMANGSNPICQWVQVQNNSYILHQTQHDHPYCCQYNPIKLMWAQIKGYLCNKTFNLFNSKWLLSTIWV